VKRTITQAVSARPVKDDHFEEWVRKEASPILKGSYDFANQRYSKTFTLTTAATGAVTTIWSDEIPDNTSWTVEFQVLGRATAGGAARAVYRKMGLFYREGGGAVQEGAVTTIAAITSVGGFLAALGVSGNDVRVQVLDDAVRTVSWQALIWVQEVSR